MPTTPTFAPPANAVPLRVSDLEREHTVGVLREHWVAGRLTVDELETRCQEAFAARYASDLWGAVRELPVPQATAPKPVPVTPTHRGQATSSLVFSSLGATLLVVSMGFMFMMTLPLSAAGWAMGRSVRRDPTVEKGRSLALVGEVLGAVGTVSACLALTACAMWLA